MHLDPRDREIAPTLQTHSRNVLLSLLLTTVVLLLGPPFSKSRGQDAGWNARRLTTGIYSFCLLNTDSSKYFNLTLKSQYFTEVFTCKRIWYLELTLKYSSKQQGAWGRLKQRSPDNRWKHRLFLILPLLPKLELFQNNFKSPQHCSKMALFRESDFKTV